jgi:hypothetical protein
MDARHSSGFSQGHARNGRGDGGRHATGSTVFTTFHKANISIVSIQGYVYEASWHFLAKPNKHLARKYSPEWKRNGFLT